MSEDVFCPQEVFLIHLHLFVIIFTSISSVVAEAICQLIGSWTVSRFLCLVFFFQRFIFRSAHFLCVIAASVFTEALPALRDQQGGASRGPLYF